MLSWILLITDSFIILLQNHWIVDLECKQHKISRHVNFWDFQTTGSRAGVNGVQETVIQEIQEDKEALLTFSRGNQKFRLGLENMDYCSRRVVLVFLLLFFLRLLLWIHISHNIKLTCNLVLIIETTRLTTDIITFRTRVGWPVTERECPGEVSPSSWESGRCKMYITRWTKVRNQISLSADDFSFFTLFFLFFSFCVQ